MLHHGVSSLWSRWPDPHARSFGDCADGHSTAGRPELRYRTLPRNWGRGVASNVSLTTFALVGLYGAWFIERLVAPLPARRVCHGASSVIGPICRGLALRWSLLRCRSLCRGLALLLQLFLLYGTHRDRRTRQMFASSGAGARCLCAKHHHRPQRRRRRLRGGRLQIRKETFEEEFGGARFSGTGDRRSLRRPILKCLAPALAVLGTNLGRNYKDVAVSR